MRKISSLLMMALLAIGMGLTSCDEQLDNAVVPGVTPGTDEGEVTSITVDLSKIDEKYLDTEKTKLQLTVGDEVTLSFTILPEEMASTEVELTAADATILSIDGLKVKALKEGETKVTAKAGDKTATCTVTVTEVYTAKDYKEGSWDGTKVVFTKKSATNYEVVSSQTSSMIIWDKAWLTVSGNVTLTGTVMLTQDVHLILQDGATLTVNGRINGTSSKYNLSIYGQANQTGQLVVNNSSDAICSITTLEVHSCQVKATASQDNCSGFYNISTFNVYGGSVDSENTGTKGNGIWLASNNSSMNIYGGEVKAVGKGDGNGSYGIMASSSSSVTVYGGKLWAECAGKKLFKPISPSPREQASPAR